MFNLKLCFVVTIIFLLQGNIYAQKKVKILNADRFRLDKLGEVKIKKLIGNVKLQQKDVIMNCDSAYIFPDNSIDAFGKIHIEQGDSVDMYAKALHFDNETKDAEISGGVTLISSRMTLKTPTMYYNVRDKVARYYSGAKIKEGNNDLTSQIGYYYPDIEIAYFRKNVVLINPDYTLKSDTLKYDIKNGISYFFDSTTIVSDSSTIFCNSGFYNSKSGVSILRNRAIIINQEQVLTADSIWYDQKNGEGKGYYNVESEDTSAKTIINSEYFYFNEKNNTALATIQAYFTYITNDDSLFLSADTLFAYESNDSVKKGNILLAYHRVKIYKEDLQGVCDSLVYRESDSLITMYKEPIIWSDSSQMTADSVTMELKNKELHKINLKKKAFMVNRTHPVLYNQIKGKNIYGFFKEGDLRKLLVEGNGESIYYAKNDSGQYIGVNKSVCSKMWIYMKEQEVDRITFLTKPDAIFHPIAEINPDDFVLKGFVWHEGLRPKSKEEITQRYLNKVTEPLE